MKIFVGVDVGSVSTNVVALDGSENILFKYYIRTNGQPMDVVKFAMSRLREELGEPLVLGVGTTGSGRQLAGVLLGADIVKTRSPRTAWPPQEKSRTLERSSRSADRTPK
jgi:activator of 2-hydroxyglutaryl-CoA dehydratase